MDHKEVLVLVLGNQPNGNECALPSGTGNQGEGETCLKKNKYFHEVFADLNRSLEIESNNIDASKQYVI